MHGPTRAQALVSSAKLRPRVRILGITVRGLFLDFSGAGHGSAAREASEPTCTMQRWELQEPKDNFARGVVLGFKVHGMQECTAPIGTPNLWTGPFIKALSTWLLLQ